MSVLRRFTPRKPKDCAGNVNVSVCQWPPGPFVDYLWSNVGRCLYRELPCTAGICPHVADPTVGITCIKQGRRVTMLLRKSMQ